MYKIKTAAVSQPISPAEAKLHLKVSASTDDDLIDDLIASATTWVEEYLDRQLMPATWYLYLDNLYTKIDLHKCPITTITSVKYYDSDNALQTLADTEYDTDVVSEPSRIWKAYGVTYPLTYDRPNVVVIEFISGYSDAASVPAPIKSALLLIIAHNYENRGDEGHRKYPKAITDLLDMYRLW